MLTEYFQDTTTSSEEHADSYRVPVEIRGDGTSLARQPVQFGICLPERLLAGAIEGELHLIESDDGIPVQVQPLVKHPDGSHQWLLIDALLPGAARYATGAFVSLREAKSEPDNVPDDPTHVVLIDRVARPLRLSIQDRTLYLEDLSPDDPVFRQTGLAFELIRKSGRVQKPVWNSIRRESAGRVRQTCLVEGVIGQRNAQLNVKLRLSFYHRTGLIKMEVCLHNARRARHPGGIWDLGDPGSELFEDFSVRILTHFDDQPLCSWFVDEQVKADIAECNHLHLYQDSSGGENWNSPAHVNREGSVACRFRGYRFEVDGRRWDGNRATPVFAIGHHQRALSVAVPEFWQQFPKCLEIDAGDIRIGLFPKEADDLHELQGGERKSSTFWMNLAAGTAALIYAVQDIETVLTPTVIAPSRNEYAWHGQIPDGTDILSDNRHSLDRLLGIALEGEQSIFAKRELVDEYGWRNYGELVADHEETYYNGPTPLISHYNNQFDPIYGFLLNYLRTGEQKLFQLGDALARHVVDIDIYHTDQDKWGYNGGLFWHSDHYRHAHTATHRSYSRANLPETGDYGGGPCNEHNYTTGLFLHYCLTGSQASREAVIGLADWVLQMDDGDRSIFRFVASGPTGLASATREETFHGPGRGAGNSLNALLDAWRLSRDEKYLNYCEALIRRCVHPHDDIAQHNLLNAEERWSYTVFLTSLLKYLKCKAQSNQLDANYQYAKASLIHYAEWMTDNERPYLDYQHQLEYPTETWAAQDLRKANVLRHAAAFLNEPRRTDCFALGHRIAQRAWADLWTFDTAACARPLAILMVEGLKEVANPPAFESEADITVENRDFGSTKAFVGQKTKVKRIVKRPWLLWKEFVSE